MSTGVNYTDAGRKTNPSEDRCCICDADLKDGYAVLFKGKLGEARIDRRCHNELSILAAGDDKRAISQALNYIRTYQPGVHPYVSKYLQQYIDHGEEALRIIGELPRNYPSNRQMPTGQEAQNSSRTRFAGSTRERLDADVSQNRQTSNSRNRGDRRNSSGVLMRLRRFYRNDKYSVKISSLTIGMKMLVTGLLVLAIGTTLIFWVIGNSNSSVDRQRQHDPILGNGNSYIDDVWNLSTQDTDDNDVIEDTDNDSTRQTIPYTDNNEVYSVSSVFEFSEGKAWIVVKDSDKNYIPVCIDKDGRALFKAEGFHYNSGYSNGYAILRKSDGEKTVYCIINDKGVITSRHEITANDSVMAYGDGYILICRKNAGFDSSVNTYEAYDGCGNLLYEFSIDLTDGIEQELTAARYCGEGVFLLRTKNAQHLWVLFSKEKNIYKNVKDDYEVHLSPATAENGVVCYNVSRSGLDLMSSDGQKWTIPYDCDWSFQDWDFYERVFGGAIVKNGSIILVSSADDNEIIRYDMSTSKFVELKEEYSRRIELDEFGLINLNYFENGYVMVPLRGTDGEMYAVIFDKDFNIVGEQVRMDSYIGYSSDRLVIERDSEFHVFDEVGNPIVNLSQYYQAMDLNLRSVSKYSDGMAQAEFYQLIGYVDLDGTLLYTDVNDIGIDTCKQIQY